MSKQAIFRFAPSPNGELHLGHAMSALTSYELSKRMEGRFFLRIEDIDKGRARPQFEQQIYDDLAWLGIKWEQPVRRQSAHFSDYRSALRDLRERGLLYPCFATRKEIREAASAKDGASLMRDPDGAPLYTGLHRELSQQKIATLKADGVPFALRLHMNRAVSMARSLDSGGLVYLAFQPDGKEFEVEVKPEEWGDVVIARKEVSTSYHLAVTYDDALQGVSHVTRGTDLLAATSVHVLLQVLLGLPTPKYHHHRLILDEKGQKLSKSRGARSLKDLREDGMSLSDIRNSLGFT